MKQKRLAPLLAVTLSLEMMLSPLVTYAQDDKGPSTLDKVNAGIQIIGGVWNQMNGRTQGNMLPPQTTADIQKLKEQQTPQVDKYFSAQKLMQIPGLSDYLALNRINPAMLDCKTLPTTMFDAQPEACRIGTTNDTGIPVNVQMAQMNAYYNEYFQINKLYSNYSADSNSDGQAFGVGCMNNAMNILNGFFKYRLDELDKLTTNLEAMQNQFREASKSDLDAIEQAVAVLEGDSDIADKVRSKNPELFDFGKRFNNPACNSMFTGNQLNDLGRSSGLNSINKSMKEELNTPGGKYSGASYAQSHASVVQDINSLADKVAKQIQLNFNTRGSDPQSYGEFLKGIPGLVSSSTGVQSAITMDKFSDLQTKYTEQYAKLAEEKALISSELPGAESALSKLGALNSATFESEVNTIENNIKNQCLTSALGDQQKLLGKIYDPSASSHANKYAANFLKDKITQILNNTGTSLEKKLADLQSIENSEGNRYYMRMENSYEVQGLDANGNITSKIVDPSSRRSPSVFFSDIINNCNAQFKANKLQNKLTGASAIQRLRNLSTNFKNFAQTQSVDAKNELRKKLIECTSPEIANNTVAGSCKPGLFDTSSPGFCANAAFSCSKNMQACSQQAEAYTQEIRTQKTARVNNYKALLEKNKQDIVKIFDTALAKYMKDGEMLRGMFGAGFSSPSGIKREVPENQRYLESFASATGKSPDGKLLLEDPDKYMEMFKGNIDLLKDSVRKQQDQILGGDSVDSNKPGLLASHIKKTIDNYKTVANQAKQTSNQCRSAYDNVVQNNKRAQDEQMKKMTELGEKRSEFCNRISMAQEDPNGACSGSMKDLLDVPKAVGTAAANKTVSQFSKFCKAYNNSSNSENAKVDFSRACMDAGAPAYKNGPTTTPKLKGELVGKIVANCNQVYLLECKSTRVPGSTDVIDSTGDCQKIEDIKSYVMNLYQDAVTGSRGSNPISLEEIDAGAVCAAQDNSNRGTGTENDIQNQINKILGTTRQ